MDRLLLFPEPFPDESLYSLAVRYHRLVANDSYRRTSQELFGTYSRTCGSVLPCCLATLSQRLEEKYSVAELVDSRTLLPLYKPFLSNDGYESALHCMRGPHGTGLKMSLGMTASGLLKHASFRYCEACMQHDADYYGVSYWHRIHMAAGVCTCPHHGNVLLRASFPEGADWRCMQLPGESTSTPVLSESSLGAAYSVAEMQFWGLSNPQRACELVREDFLRWRLTEMGMLQQGRLREQAINSHVERRFSNSTHEGEFQSVTVDTEWVMRLLRRRRRIVQPFRYYFLCWLLETSAEDLVEFQHKICPRALRMNSLVKDRCDSGSPVEIAERRRNFQSDRDKKLHDRQGYYWLYRHDRDWLQNYVKSYPFIRTRKVYVDWFSRDIALSNELVTAHAEIMAEKDKPKKITKSALLRRVQNHYGFLRKSSKFPKSIQVLESLLETEHDYQLRKVAWALKELQLPKNYAISVIMRLAGIRIRQISHLEIEDLLQARGNGDNL